MAVSEFLATELVTRGNVNNRITQINSDVTQINTNIANLEPVQLYHNSSGTQNTITLSADISGFSYAQIFTKHDGDAYTSQMVYSPNGKRVALSLIIGQTSNSEMLVFAAGIDFSGTTVTWSSGTNVFEAIKADGVYYLSPGALSITKIIGYKYQF